MPSAQASSKISERCVQKNKKRKKRKWRMKNVHSISQARMRTEVESSEDDWRDRVSVDGTTIVNTYTFI